MTTRHPLESEVQKQCLAHLEAHYGDWLIWWRNNTGAVKGEYKGKNRLVTFGVAGAADILGYTQQGATFFACEVKAKGEKPTPVQWEYLIRVQHCGGIAFWIDDAERFNEIMSGIRLGMTVITINGVEYLDQESGVRTLKAELDRATVEADIYREKLKAKKKRERANRKQAKRRAG